MMIIRILFYIIVDGIMYSTLKHRLLAGVPVGSSLLVKVEGGLSSYHFHSSFHLLGIPKLVVLFIKDVIIGFTQLRRRFCGIQTGFQQLSPLCVVSV